MENYYEIIGVDIKDDITTIKAEYLSKIKKYHPDLYEGDKLFAEQMTSKLTQAYNVLKDEELRKEYDLNLNKNKQKNKKNYFKNIWKKIKNYFKNIFNSKNKQEMSLEQREKRKLNIVILLQVILIIVLLILVIVT